jgi:hypothetical protein
VHGEMGHFGALPTGARSWTLTSSPTVDIGAERQVFRNVRALDAADGQDRGDAGRRAPGRQRTQASTPTASSLQNISRAPAPTSGNIRERRLGPCAGRRILRDQGTTR